MSTRTIQQIESEIQAMKDANPNWTTNSGVMALITALTNEKNNLFLPPQAEALSSDLANMCISTQSYQITSKGQYTASSFCNHLPTGFGYLPLLTRFDPTQFLLALPNTLTARLIPSLQEISNAPYLKVSGEKPAYQSGGETAAYGVQRQTLEALRDLDCYVENGQIQFGSRQLGIGLAKENSYNDIHIHLNGLYVTEFENKGAESSLLPAVAQSSTSATNFCIGLMSKGVPREECIVPVISNTGINICFGATIMLDKSFPTYIPLSKQLDLLDEHENKTASAYFIKIKDHSHRLSKIPRLRNVPPVTEIILDLENYFIKTITQEVFDRGLGLFTNSEDKLDIQNGLNHITPDTETIETSGGSRCNYFEIIYRNLVKLGFVTGTPSRVKQPSIYEAFKTELKRVIGLIHNAGVIHVDFYSSNIMWKSHENEKIEIKIVDWDVSHCIDELHFSPKIEKILAQRIYAGKRVPFGRDHDLLYLAVYEMDLTEENQQHWNDLASGEKQRIDAAFQALMTEFTRQLL
eukprot:gene14756-16385_t